MNTKLITGFDFDLFSSDIKIYRLSKGESLRGFTDYTGISAATLSRIENKTMLPDIETFFTLVKNLKLDANKYIK